MINLRGIDLNLLPVFEAVYADLNQVKVAERLGMTQPTVSHAIGRLRQAIGDPLFISGPKGLVATQKAHDLYPHIHQALNLIRGELGKSRRFEPATTQREFVLALTYGAGEVFSSPLQARLQSAAPHARLVIRTIDPEQEIPDLLRRRKLDVAIHHKRFNDQRLDDTKLEQPQFWEDDWVLIASDNHPRIQHAPSLEQLSHEQFVSAYQLFEDIEDGDTEVMLEIIKQQTQVELPNIMLLPRMVKKSELVAVVLSRLAESFREIFGTRIYPLPVPLPPLRCCIIWHRSMTDDPENRWLREQLWEIQAELKSSRRYDLATLFWTPTSLSGHTVLKVPG